MPVPIFPPRKDAELVSWSTNFDQMITASAVTFGLSVAQATAYTSLHTVFKTSYAAATNPNTNSHAATVAKNDAKENLLYGEGGAWELVRIVQAFPGTTNTMRGELGLRLPDTQPTPIPVPSSAPQMFIESTAGRNVRMRLRDALNPDRRGKPEGVAGATVLYAVGETAPSNPSEFTFATNSSRTVFDVVIPGTVPAGSKVWLTAFWYNARAQSGVASPPESVRVSDGLAQAA